MNESILMPGEKVLLEVMPSRILYTFRWLSVSVFGVGLVLLWFGYHNLLKLPQVVNSVGEFGLLALEILGIPLLLMGLFLAAGPIAYSFLEAGKVRYLVTDRRIIIRRGVFRVRDVEIFLERVALVEAKRSALFGGKAGSIKLLVAGSDSGSPFYMRKFPSEKFRGPVVYVLDGLVDVEGIKNAVEEAVLAAAGWNPSEGFLHQSL